MAEQQAQGTEYTLQGVMRFLQLEWHNHERARNTWDIERAELKAKIAKQEGDLRNSKKLNDSLTRQLRMMERVVRNERAKSKALSAGKDPPSDDAGQKMVNGNSQTESKAVWNLDPSGVPSDLENELESARSEVNNEERDEKREKSKTFLRKCTEETAYILTPPAHPLPSDVDPQQLQNQNMLMQQDHRSAMDEVYLHQQQQQQMRRNQPQNLSSLPPMQNHHPPPPVRQAPEVNNNHDMRIQHPQHQAAMMSRQISNQPMAQSRSHNYSEEFPQHYQNSSAKGFEEPVEKVSHSFDVHGQPIPEREEEMDPARPIITEDTDGWNFDDTGLGPDNPHEASPPRRPDTDLFPSANSIPAKSPTRPSSGPHRRKSSGSTGMVRKRSDGSHEIRDLSSPGRGESANFKVRFALRGHTDVIRSIIFTGGGSPSEPEICTTGDDGTIKRWILPSNYSSYGNTNQHHTSQPANDLDIQSYFTHRGHDGMVTCLACCPPSASFSTGGRVSGDGWVFSGGQDATIRVWERGRVDPKATLEGHTDAVWALCVLPTTTGSIFGQESNLISSNGDRILVASGSSDNSIKIWAVSAPPQLSSPSNGPSGSRRGVGGSRRHSITSGSNFPSSPQPSTASGTPFHSTLVHSIEFPRGPSAAPTCISPLGTRGENFVVSYADSSILIFDTRTGEEVVGMASSETYDGTRATSINSVVVTSNSSGGLSGLDSGVGVANAAMGSLDATTRALGEDEGVVHGATGSSKDGGVEGVVISGHEDRYVRFFDANSGQCTYSMLAHPAAIASLSVSPEGRELVSAGHDASLRFWSLEKRSCVQEITSHRLMRGEGVVSVVWSQDGRWVVSGGGDGVVKVFGR